MAARDVEVPSSTGLYEQMFAPVAKSADEPAPAATEQGRQEDASPVAAAPPPAKKAAAAPKKKAEPKSGGTRPDAEGMRRWSLYSTEASGAAFDAAVERILAVLGPDTPKQVAISALLEYAAAGVETVEADLVEARTRELEARLAALQHRV